MREYMAIASTYELLVEITKDIKYENGVYALVGGVEYIYQDEKWVEAENAENNDEIIE